MRKYAALLVLPLLLSACAGHSPGILPAEITLTRIEVGRVTLRGQSLRLEFHALNPNPFPLPVRAVKYELVLADEKVARGESASSFAIPARGEGAFALDVETDVLNTLPRLGLLLRERVAYELHGSLTVDLPFARPVPFSASGNIELRPDSSG